MDPKVVRYSRRLRRISLQRFLVSKVVFEHNKVASDDMLALFDNQLWLEKKCSTDVDFQKKFGKTLEVLSSILKNINLSRGLSSKTLSSLSLKLSANLKGFFVPQRNYKDFKSRFSGSFTVRATLKPEEANRNLPPKRYMGIGYRDKGTARDPARDGSPSWQEVASRAGQFKLAERRIRDAKNFKEIERVFRDLFGSDLSGGE